MRNIDVDLDELIRAGILEGQQREELKSFLLNKYQSFQFKYDTLVKYFDQAVEKAVNARIRQMLQELLDENTIALKKSEELEKPF